MTGSQQPDGGRPPDAGGLPGGPSGVRNAHARRRDTFRRLAGYLDPYRGLLLVQVVASLGLTAANLIPPAIMRWIIDDVLVPRGRADVDARLRLLGIYVVALFGVRLAGLAFEWLHARVVAWLGARVTADVRSDLYRRLEALALGFYDRHEVGALTSRVTNDTGTLQEFLIRRLPYLLTNSLTIVGIFIMLMAIDWQLALFAVLPVPIVWIWSLYFWRRMSDLFGQWSEANARFSARLAESLSGIREVKAFGQEQREIGRFGALNAEVFRRTVSMARNHSTLLATMGLVTGCSVSILWLLGGAKTLQQDLTLGALVSFYSYVLLFYAPLQWFGQFSDSMTRSLTAAERIFEILDAPREAPEEGTTVRMEHVAGRIRFRNVTFGYDRRRTVLDGLNLSVEPGQMIGIVGRSGAGKTTMMNLLCRFYDVDAGSIEADGVDIRRVHLEDLRSQIGIVPQDPVLFSGSIADNIRYGQPGATLQEVIEAAAVANAHRFVIAKPLGYDTEVGERGRNLSVGERQRVAIARAVLRNPRILILDEATASVDALSEALIHEAIHRLAEGRTCFIIAHRLSTLMIADRLVVLESGRIQESGTFEELMAREGLFQDLVRVQEESLDAMMVRVQ